MVSVHFPNIFNAKIIDTVCKKNGLPVVLPETRVDFALVIALSLESFFQEFLCNYTCLREPIHSLLDVHVHIPIMCYVPEFVEVNDVVGNVRQFEPHKFWAFHWCIEIKIFDVDGHELCISGRDDTVESILMVIMSAVGVPQSPGKLIRLPPTVRRMR